MLELDVVIPVRFGARFLPEALGSILGQTGVDAHVIVVDDGCPDDLASLIVGVPGASVTCLRNDGPPGIGSARNRGVDAVTRPLLGFLDADDLWPSDRTEALQGLLDHHPDALAFGMVEQFIDPSGESSFRVPEAPQRGMVAGGMLVRTDVFRAVGPFDETLLVGEYIDWVARARAAGVGEVTTDRIVLRRRIHGDNTTVHRRDNYDAYLTVVRRQLARRGGT